MLSNLRVALVADWLTSIGGAESVVRALHDMFPQAPIFTFLHNKKKHSWLQNADVSASFFQKIPLARDYHQFLISFMPYYFEQLDLDDFDLVISSSHACSKGVITKPATLHICYCHTPMRYLWDDCHEYVRQYLPSRYFSFAAHHFLHSLRRWDKLAADRADIFLANSNYVARRIQKYYRRESEIVYPPVDLSGFSPSIEEGNYYVAIGRLIPYKRFDLLIETFNRLKLPLKIVGTGREYASLKRLASDNVSFLGFVSREELNSVLQRAKALIFPQCEDFGIVPLEAMACGKPVIAYGCGGVLETVIQGETGIFFQEQSVDALSSAIAQFQHMRFDPVSIASHVQKFSVEAFKERMTQVVESCLVNNPR